ncbi:MAG: Retron-type reverse transcriptase [Candidatus Moranbacteria bacterium GW2011_GWE2_35_2-]|nr:MAG: Retron-type reverse transcriptase [Candidatus Moranbacteria bacterium GW2011_GWE2_35_2-]KKQ21768.1 MAG: Retron-type reverse transcriptase [Candidatus Moranbacteria bacterium GW2011_GWF2_37_11]KKQ31208.1 MAG: Retron-type reverse transcriptase [Candidatus Moranbacteria bacterium GW2011_GWE1_37_24]
MSIFTYKNLYQAYLDCRKNKRKTINALKFELDFERNLRILLRDLVEKKYRPGRSICFAVDEPSLREIFAADFRDRIVHHLLVREINNFFERRFIFDSFACRKGKGTHKSVKRLQEFVRSTRKTNCYYGQFDIKSFFMSIDHKILYDILEKNLRKGKEKGSFKKSREKLEEILWLAKTIIFHRANENYSTKGDLELLAKIPPHKSLLRQNLPKGLPIGNYSSQFFANLYLNELDQFVKRTLKCKKYVRYVDDFIILGKNSEELKVLRNIVDDFLQEKLSLNLNFNKCKIQPIKNGIDFLGYFVKTDRIHTRRKVIKRYKNKLYRIAIGLEKTNMRSLLSMVHSYAGHFKHAR